MPFDTATPILSILVKCYNESAKLDLCLRSLIAAAARYDAEIIVVDSLSTDNSVEIAESHPIRVVQLADFNDKRCGAVAELGYQCARGQFILLIDGDMELLPDFLPTALPLFDRDERLAGVGGRLIELSDGLEFRERQIRGGGGHRTGDVERITGCGLYRAKAINSIGYLMNRNLHCFEEFELGLRLRAGGWRMTMLATPCVRHHGHRDASLKLLVRRWRTRFLHGHGELLRDAWGKPYFVQATRPCRIPAMVIGWWIVLAALAVAAISVPWARFALPIVAILPWLVLWGRKRSVSRATHAFLTAQFSAASLIGGLLSPRIDPRRPIEVIVLKDSVPSTTRSDR